MVFDSNLDFWQKFGFLTKNLDFLTKFFIFGQVLDFWAKFGFWTKNWSLKIWKTKKLDFSQEFGFWQKCGFLTKIPIFDKKFDFWQKLRLLTRISTFYKNFDFWQKFRLLTKISTFDKNFDFWKKCGFLNTCETSIIKWYLRIYDVNMQIDMGSGLPAGIRTKLVFVVWAPATSSIKQKMVTASSKDALKKKLDGFQVIYWRRFLRGTDHKIRP